MAALLGALAAFLALQGVAVWAGLRGLVVLPRGLPRPTGPALLAAGVGLGGWALGQAPAASAAGLVVGLLVGPLLASLNPLDPDATVLAGATPLPADGPDAQAVLLRPATDPIAIVALLHGGGNDRIFALWEVVPLLVSRGCAVALFHHAGHGAGGTDRLSLEAARSRIDTVLQSVRAALPGVPLFALGQSLGGALLLDLVARGCEGLRGAITVSAPTRIQVGMTAMREFGGLLRRPLWRALRFATLLEALPALGPFRRRRFPVRTTEPRPYLSEFAHVIQELALTTRLPASPGAFPVLVIQGEADGVVPASQAAEIARALGPRAQLRLLPGGHHLDPLFDPRALRAVAEFIDAGRGALPGAGPTP